MAEDWKLQVSYKLGSGDLINIRANTGDELSVLLESIGDYSTQIAAVQRMVSGAYNVAPLGTTTTTTSIAPSVNSAPPQAVAPSATGPTCVHGPRKHKSGISGPNSKQPGKPYSMWVCSMPQGPEQCPPVN